MKYSVPSPFGALTITLDDDALVALDWGGAEPAPTSGLGLDIANQLNAYFDGSLTTFNIPLAGFKSDFAKRFATAMCDIPYGDTCTYGDIAKATGISAQAAGQACGSNRIPIIVPCHRVMGAKGLVGYSGKGGVETKVALLKLEGAAGFLI
ncbi:MAG: methylated-DNA--[protein]-cysteine S-methyltransferase [Planktomarina sp.]